MPRREKEEDGAGRIHGTSALTPENPFGQIRSD